MIVALRYPVMVFFTSISDSTLIWDKSFPSAQISVYLCPMLKQTLLKATEAGAAVIRQFFEGEFKISNKEGVNNLVTEADHAAEKSYFQSYPGKLS